MRYTHDHRWDSDSIEKWWVSADIPDAEDHLEKPAASHDLLDGDTSDLGVIGEAVLDVGNMQSHGLRPDLMEQIESIVATC